MSQKGDPLRAAGPQTCYLLTLGLGLSIWALLWVVEDKEGCTGLSQPVQVGAWYVPTVIFWWLLRLPYPPCPAQTISWPLCCGPCYPSLNVFHEPQPQQSMLSLRLLFLTPDRPLETNPGFSCPSASWLWMCSYQHMSPWFCTHNLTFESEVMYI